MQNEIIASAKEALAFAKCDANECVVHYPNDKVNTDAECPVIPVHDMGIYE